MIMQWLWGHVEKSGSNIRDYSSRLLKYEDGPVSPKLNDIPRHRLFLQLVLAPTVQHS